MSAVPVTVLTGFLGAGKTTLLQRILSDPQGVRYGVLVNDFGAINIDAALVASGDTDQVSLANGCICCSIRDDLVEAVARLLAASPAPEHVLIETSGVSRPIAVVDALDDPAVGKRLRLDAVFCLVDAAAFRRLDYASTELALEQAAGSDLVILNKCDVASPEDRDAAEATLRGAFPGIRILPTRFAEVPRDVLFGPRERRPTDSAHRHHHHDHAHNDHGDEFDSWSWTSDRPLDRARFRDRIRALPPTLLRAKGVLAFADRPERRFVFQLVGRRQTLAADESAAPASSAFVAIARRGALDRDALTALLDGCRAEV